MNSPQQPTTTDSAVYAREFTHLSPFQQNVQLEILRKLRAVPDRELRFYDGESPEQVAARFVASVRTQNEWDRAVGPFYATRDLVPWLGLNHRSNLQHSVHRGEIIAVKVGRTRLYPTFQFSESGQPLPHLAQVIEILAPALPDPWEQALWLNSPLEGQSELTAATLLRAGHRERVAQMARDDVERWSQ